LSCESTAAAAPARLRRPRPEEAAAITELVVRSKRYWGYDDAFIASLADELAFTPERLADPVLHVELLETNEGPVGVFSLRRRTELAFLEDLWVEPSAMGRGHGRRLFRRAVEVAHGWGKGVLEWESDPFAEPFYLHLGATRVGMVPSSVIPGRSLPLMRYPL
jgi:GNAT superfamily N-acetyltransferase